MQELDEPWIRSVFQLHKPRDWAFLIGCRGTSSQIPDNEKWCTLKDATYLFHKEFMPNYHGSVTTPPWEYWMKYGLIALADNPSLMHPFHRVANVYGQEEIEKILGRFMPKYFKYEIPQDAPDPFANAVPMPGAGKPNPTIKDVKGERLS